MSIAKVELAILYSFIMEVARVSYVPQLVCAKLLVFVHTTLAKLQFEPQGKFGVWLATR